MGTGKSGWVRQMPSDEHNRSGKEEGGVGIEGGCNKRAVYMGGKIRALGGTRRIG